MKRSLLIISLLLCAAIVVQSQSPAQQLSERIAQKMKDSLSLTSQQKTQLYDINMQLSNQKATARQQYAGSDSVRYYMQRIENSRDSLYRPVLGETKFELYRQKKRNLVNNN